MPEVEYIPGHGTPGEAGRRAAWVACSQRAISGEPSITFAVRMGLHTGSAVERNENYVGTEVNRAARLTALGHGGQILVSDTTAAMLRSRLELRALGEHALRGLRGRVGVFQIIVGGLPSVSRAMRARDASSLVSVYPPPSREPARRLSGF